MSALIFEDDAWRNFAPLASTRHVSQQLLGSMPLLDHLKVFGEVSLMGREELAEAVSEETDVPYNEGQEGTVLLVNGRANPLRLGALPSGRAEFVLAAGREIVIGRLHARSIEAIRGADGTVSQRRFLAKSKGMERLSARRGALFRYPWEMLAENGAAISVRGDEPTMRPSSLDFKGPGGNLRVSEEAEVEKDVFFDARNGPIVVEEGAIIEAFSRLSGPCFVGREARVHSALVRGGSSIGEGCRVGGEVENSVVYPYSNKAHLGYLGHSVVGEWVNLGAGSQVSDLKNTYGTVRVQIDGKRVDSRTVKLGSLVGDMAKVSIGCLVYSGKAIGVSAHVSGRVERDVPSFTYYEGGKNGGVELRLASVLETQERMMARRGRKLRAGRKRLIERLFKEGEAERRRLGVRKGSLVS